MTVAESDRHTVARALYVDAITLIVIPLSNVLPALWPLRPAAAKAVWNLGVGGAMSLRLAISARRKTRLV